VTSWVRGAASRAGGLPAQPGYPALFLAATLSRLASEMFAVAVVLLVLERTGRPGLAGAVVAATTLPSVVTGPVLGAWLDRTTRRRAALASNQVLLGASLLAFLAVAGRAPGWTLLPLAGLAGITAPLATGGFTSMIPLLVPERLLPRANALEATSFNAAAIAGPALAGAAAAGFGPATAVVLEADLAGLALLAIARLPRVEVQAGAAAESLASAIGHGLGHLARTPILRGVTVATAVGMGGTGLLTLALPFWAERLGVGRAGAGYLWAALEAGAIVGALAAARQAAAWPPQRVVLAGLGLFGLVMAAWPLAPSFPVALALVGLAGLVEGPAFAATFATRQRWSPPRLRGQIFTTAASLKVGAFAVGAALAGPALDQAGVAGTLLLVGAVQLLAVALGFVAGVRGSGRSVRRRFGACPKPGQAQPPGALRQRLLHSPGRGAVSCRDGRCRPREAQGPARRRRPARPRPGWPAGTGRWPRWRSHRCR
jgi:predicted MFS family arabinose efflux permease